MSIDEKLDNHVKADNHGPGLEAKANSKPYRIPVLTNAVGLTGVVAGAYYGSKIGYALGAGLPSFLPYLTGAGLGIIGVVAGLIAATAVLMPTYLITMKGRDYVFGTFKKYKKPKKEAYSPALTGAH